MTINNIITRGTHNLMSKKIKNARKIIRDALNNDRGFEIGYISNIAMAIYDEFPEELVTIGKRDKHVFVNDCARRILNLLFNDK